MPDVVLPEKRKVDSSILSLTTTPCRLYKALISKYTDCWVHSAGALTDREMPRVPVRCPVLSHVDRTRTQLGEQWRNP